MSVKSKLLFYSVFLGLLALIPSGVVRADSVTVKVGGTTYDITTLTGTFSDNSATLEGTPWFGNSALAESLAAAVGASFGTPQNTLEFGQNYGPLFAYELVDGGVTGVNTAVFDIPDGSTSGSVSGLDWYPNISAIWATGSVVPPAATPEPGTLSLMIAAMLGLGLLVGIRRDRPNYLSTEV